MIWYVRRRADNSIASTYSEIQPGLAEEALDDQVSAELQAYLSAARPDLSAPDTLEKALKAVLLAAASMSGKTVAQARAAFTTAWRALP